MDKQEYQYIDGVSKEIQNAIFDGRKIEAIKVFREEKGVDLKEAKEEVELLTQTLKEQFPNQFRELSANGQGCLLSATCFFLLITGSIAAIIFS